MPSCHALPADQRARGPLALRRASGLQQVSQQGEIPGALPGNRRVQVPRKLGSLCHQLFSYVKPATVIELGTFVGGMAIWITDTLKLLDIPYQVYSMDVDLSQLD